MAENYIEHMSYDWVQSLRKNSASWRLLATRNAPFVMAFLYHVFLKNVIREIPESELENKLELFIEHNDISDAQSPREYLLDWSDDEHGWLRRFYPKNSGLPHYDLTASAQKAIEWLSSLQKQSFVGTESKLVTVFLLLQEITTKTNDNPEDRIRELNRQKAQLDAEIAAIQAGRVQLLNSTQIKDRYMQILKVSNEIMSDFREVEQNFRILDQEIRAELISWDRSKGAFLTSYFGKENDINESEQGKSFEAFWRFLSSKEEHDTFYQMIRQMLELPPLQDMPNRQEIQNVEVEWIKGSEHVQSTIAQISKQLNRFLNDGFMEKEVRIKQIISNIDKLAIAIKETPPKEDFMEIDGISLDIALPMERALYAPKEKIALVDEELIQGVAEDAGAILYNFIYVDTEILISNIADVLHKKEKTTLKEVLAKHKITKGVAEIIAYFEIAKNNDFAHILPHDSYDILWQDGDIIKKVNIPNIVFEKGENPWTI